jgi:CheY-like chemotaxis protein
MNVQKERKACPGREKGGGEPLSKNVLIVDDEKEMLLVLRKALEPYREAFSVLIAAHGEEALDVLKEQEVHLVVTDLIMPRMDGFSLLVHIRSDYPQIPVIIMTAHSRPVMERMAWKIGVAEYIEKPFDVKDLERKIVANLGEGEGEGGGGLRGMKASLFLQLVELEHKTCEIRLLENATRREGSLFFRDGLLVDARLEDRLPEDAAREMVSWSDVEISIRKNDSATRRRISFHLQDLLRDVA